jgi:hypothetical protein
MIRLAFTTRFPLAVMIAMDIKLWENRRHQKAEVNNDRDIMFCTGKFSALRPLHDIRNDAAARIPAV